MGVVVIPKNLVGIIGVPKLSGRNVSRDFLSFGRKRIYELLILPLKDATKIAGALVVLFAKRMPAKEVRAYLRAQPPGMRQASGPGTPLFPPAAPTKLIAAVQRVIAGKIRAPTATAQCVTAQ